MKKRSLLFPVFLQTALLFPSIAISSNTTLTTYHPSPQGSYDRLRIIPRNVLAGPACDSGMLYVETGGQLHYCVDDGSGISGRWGSIAGVFTQSGNNIYPMDTDTNSNLKVGIGTINPQADLHVAGDGSILLSGTRPTLTLQDNGVGNDDFAISVNSNLMNLQSNDSGAFTNRMTITSNGNVGINQANPQAKLHIQGNQLLTGSEFRIQDPDPIIYWDDIDGNDFRLIHVSTGYAFQGNGSGSFDDKFLIGNDKHSRAYYSVTIEGEDPTIGFYDYDGTSWDQCFSIKATHTWLHFNSESSGNLYREFGISDRGDGVVVRHGQVTTDPSTNGTGAYTRIGPGWMNFDRWSQYLTDRIYYHGARLTAAGVWLDGSSRNFKTNIRSLSLKDALNTLNELKPVTYDSKNDKNLHSIGFIAEDVPDLIATPDKKSVRRMDFIAVITKVVQHQQKELESQDRLFQKQKDSLETIEQKLNTLLKKKQQDKKGAL